MVVEREYKKDDFDSRNSRIGMESVEVWQAGGRGLDDWIEIANEAAQIQREMGREKWG